MSNLTPGPELDALVAEEVMEWVKGLTDSFEWWWVGRNGEETGWLVEDALYDETRARRFDPSTDIAAAWEVIRKLIEDDIYWSLAQTEDGELCGAHFHRSGPVDGTEMAGVVPLKEGRGLVDSLWVWKPTIEHAICLAALKAVGALE